MFYEWDDSKAQLNHEKHGVSFTGVEQFDWTSALVKEDTRLDYGESRYNAVGLMNDRLYQMTFTGTNARLDNMATKSKLKMSDSDDKRIQSGIDQDPENPEWTDDDFNKARPAAEVLPQIVKAYKEGTLKRRTRGSQKEPTKEPISIRIDQDVVKYYRKKGRGWQAQLNQDLRKAAGLEKNH